MARKIVAGNWKMNGTLALVDLVKSELAPALNADSVAAEVVVLPPSLYLDHLIGSGVKVGIQNVSQYESGAYTGETAARMAADIGCQYALIGHSERREHFGDSDEVVAQKVRRVIEAGLMPMLCVGEHLSQRESGQAEQVVSTQLKNALVNCEASELESLVIAYEPVWAIGTGVTATPEQAQSMHAFIREQLDKLGVKADLIPLLYGGSVKAANAEELFGQPDIDGGLVGGASLNMAEFLSIYRAMR